MAKKIGETPSLVTTPMGYYIESSTGDLVLRRWSDGIDGTFVAIEQVNDFSFESEADIDAFAETAKELLNG